MLASAVVRLAGRSLPSKNGRVLVFAFGAIVCAPGVIINIVQAALAGDANTRLAWTSLAGSALLGSLAHAFIALGIHSERRLCIFVADLLIAVGIVLAVIGISGIAGK